VQVLGLSILARNKSELLPATLRYKYEPVIADLLDLPFDRPLLAEEFAFLDE
jgi:hypothetical protein